jgi:hypothetical protein
MTVDGLYDPFEDTEVCTIYSALFDECLHGYDTYRMRGNYNYGFDEWVNH